MGDREGSGATMADVGEAGDLEARSPTKTLCETKKQSDAKVHSEPR